MENARIHFFFALHCSDAHQVYETDLLRLRQRLPWKMCEFNDCDQGDLPFLHYRRARKIIIKPNMRLVLLAKLVSLISVTPAFVAVTAVGEIVFPSFAAYVFTADFHVSAVTAFKLDATFVAETECPAGTVMVYPTLPV